MASILKIVITRNAICDNLVGFRKSGHLLSWWWLYIVWMFHLAIKQFEGFVKWLNEVYALISVHISH